MNIKLESKDLKEYMHLKALMFGEMKYDFDAMELQFSITKTILKIKGLFH